MGKRCTVEEKLKLVYEYAVNQYESLLERKRHIEIKTLYLLQIIVVLVTLFVGIVNSLVSSEIKIIILQSVFYIAALIALVLAIISLNDNINIWFSGKKGEIRDISIGKMKELALKDGDLEEFYKEVIDSIDNSKKRLIELTANKVKCFNMAILCTCIATTVLILIGYTIM